MRDGCAGAVALTYNVIGTKRSHPDPGLPSHPTMNHSNVPDTVWRARLQAFVDAWPRMNEQMEALHQVRVASRRLREALPVVSDGRHRKKARKARRMMRRVTRALGPVRELDVAIKTLNDLEADAPAARAGIEYIREHLIAERAERRAEMAERLASVTPEKVERRFVALLDVETPPTKRHHGGKKRRPTHKWRSVLAARIARRAKALVNAVQRAGAIYLPDRLHAVRVSVKKLRYAVEVGRDARVPRTASMLRTLKVTQDTLGSLHDLEVLIDRVRVAQGSLKPESSPVAADLDAVIKRLEQQCRRLHAQFVGRREELLGVCDQAVSDLHRVLASIRPAPARVLPAGSGTARPPRRESAADARVAADKG
jgi:CHAD domain-containing protein